MIWRVNYRDRWGYSYHEDFDSVKAAWDYYYFRAPYDDSVQEPVQISIFDIIKDTANGK